MRHVIALCSSAKIYDGHDHNSEGDADHLAAGNLGSRSTVTRTAETAQWSPKSQEHRPAKKVSLSKLRCGRCRAPTGGGSKDRKTAAR